MMFYSLGCFYYKAGWKPDQKAIISNHETVRAFELSRHAF
jgi:hypothetical protein